jgi:hypothetical protein
MRASFLDKLLHFQPEVWVYDAEPAAPPWDQLPYLLGRAAVKLPALLLMDACVPLSNCPVQMDFGQSQK